MNSEFCIISNDCWGAEVYIERKIAYNTPFVGLFIPPSHFVKISNNLHEYFKLELVFIKETKFKEYEEHYIKEPYPIALLGDIEIHFLHYKDDNQANEKWKRRLDRMPKDSSKWFIKGCDREISDWPELISLWNSIPFNKVFFSATKRSSIDDLIYITESYDEYVTDGKALYELSKDYFDVDKWIDSDGLFRQEKHISFKRKMKFLFAKLKYKIKNL